MPSAVSPWLLWKLFTAASVPGPKMPSALMPSSRWRRTTADRFPPPVDALRARLPLSALHVTGPTMPSAVRPWLRWKRLTARLVPGPKIPSEAMPSQLWTFATRAPSEPRLSGFASAAAGASSSTATANAAMPPRRASVTSRPSP